MDSKPCCVRCRHFLTTPAGGLCRYPGAGSFHRVWGVVPAHARDVVEDCDKEGWFFPRAQRTAFSRQDPLGLRTLFGGMF